MTLNGLFELQDRVLDTSKTSKDDLKVEPKKKAGNIEMIVGPMYSGKTSKLQMEKKKCEIAGKNVFVISYSGDSKRTGELNIIKTHDGFKSEATFVDKCGLTMTFDKSRDFDVVIIDEGQFFDNLKVVCESWSNQGVRVIVAGLVSTFKRDPFRNMTDLLSIANKITMLTAICKGCKKDIANCSQRIDESEQLELIGGKDKYIPVCTDCFKHKCEY